MVGHENESGVVTANSSANNSVNDVIGNKTDTSPKLPGTGSLYTLAGYMGYYHVHSPSVVYPRDADPTTLTATTGVGTWTAGTIVEVIPADTITDVFDIHFVILGEISANGNYVVKLYTGASGEEELWGECAFTRDTNQVRGSQVPIQGSPVDANTRISAALLSDADDGETVAIKLYTHTYP